MGKEVCFLGPEYIIQTAVEVFPDIKLLHI